MRRPFNPARLRRARRRGPHALPVPRPGRPSGDIDGGPSDIEVLSTARQLVERYGREASSVALMRAAEFAAFGDHEGLAAWEAVVTAVDFLLAAHPGLTGLH
ncbi:hypothetical protein [Zavarzinia compransoris]|uniref:Uncharacterized protein n=1 Tax=Zavarzinia compransoris TaxID=1264899 RepID=A0A317ECS8_9PROT|nr:hypothetical protein [Zavarzinia compransoris]PWR23940.1 hypothetical protein DKG75_05160 [Zavarzinia compransoris]TDP48187.1 hypothetical protein DES42_102490 [Zavarzinia compransoris]